MTDQSPKLGAVLSEAQSIIQAAEERAQETTALAEKTYQEAQERGYQEGFEKGHAEVVKSAVRMLEESSTLGQRLAEEAAQLALAISSFVIGKQVELDPSTVKGIALKAIQESVIGESAQIRVHPDDKKSIQEFIEELRRLAGGAAISIDTDGSMTRGGCVVQTEFGEVDASIEALISAVSSRLGVSNKT